MKKFYYNNWFANKLLSKLYHTITVGIVVLTKRDKLDLVVKNHESIHIQQVLEMTLITLVMVILLASVGFLSWKWTILSLFAYYVWYVLEWLIRCIIICFIGVSKFTGHKDDNIAVVAYDNLGFEKEANANEENETYIIDRPWFNWVRYIKLGRIDK